MVIHSPLSLNNILITLTKKKFENPETLTTSNNLQNPSLAFGLTLINRFVWTVMSMDLMVPMMYIKKVRLLYK